MTALPLLATLAAAATLALPADAPVMPALVAQIQQSAGHYHEGEFGRQFLLVEQALKCNCGCGLDVHSCQYQMQCGTSPDWSSRIRRDLEAGLTPDQIKAKFVDEYGPAVLMAPPAEGFNLVGYFLPLVAILGAAGLVALVIRSGMGRRGALETVPVEEPTDAERARLEAELRRLEESESPDW